MSEPLPDAEPELRARRASSFGDHAVAYAQHRPDYPRNALEWGLSGTDGTPRRVLDLGAGTGKVTAGLVELGLDVTAVEPDRGMLAELSRILPSVTALIGQAERIPSPDAAFDAVFVGQAFHWFDPVPAMAEIARVLRPGGVLVTLWNDEDQSAGWVAEFKRLGQTGQSRKWGHYEETLRHPAFAPFARAAFPHVLRRTAETLVQTIATHSHVLVAPPEETAEVLRKLREFLAANPETAYGEFDLPLETTVYRAKRL